MMKDKIASDLRRNLDARSEKLVILVRNALGVYRGEFVEIGRS